MEEYKYTMIDKDELLEKVNEEIEVLESIYADDGVILKKPLL